MILLNSKENTTGKKYGGRKKGTPNIMTKELRSIYDIYLIYSICYVYIHYVS